MRLLILLLVLSALILTSCATGGEAAPVTDVKNNNNEGHEPIITEEAASFEDELGSYNFNGETFHMFSRLQSIPMFHGALNVEVETGDVLNDAIYLRNRRLEDRFNFLFVETIEPTTDAARTAVLAGDDTYDIINTRCTYAYNYAEEGLIYAVADLPEINLNKGYWDAKLTSEMTVGHKEYFAVGAFNLTSYDFTHVMLFNKGIVESHGLDDLYHKVLDYKWTFDEFNKYAAAVTKDLNGDSVMDENDMFGLVSSAKQIPPNFWISAGLTSVQKDSDDMPIFTLSSDEKFFTVFEKIYKITWDSNAWMVTTSTANVPDEAIAQFQNNGALFIDCTAFIIPSFRAMDADFGIIPYPMWDEIQGEYLTRIEGCELFCVPLTNKNLEKAGVILEAMASESTKGVVDAYYEISLRTKFTRDVESMDMLDIIFANRVFDWGDTIWCPEIRDGIFNNMFRTNDRDLASKTATLDATVLALIEKTVTAFEKLN